MFKHTDFFVIGMFGEGYHPVLNIRWREYHLILFSPSSRLLHFECHCCKTNVERMISNGLLSFGLMHLSTEGFDSQFWWLYTQNSHTLRTFSCQPRLKTKNNQKCDSIQLDAVEHERLCPINLAQDVRQLTEDRSKCIFEVIRWRWFRVIWRLFDDGMMIWWCNDKLIW